MGQVARWKAMRRVDVRRRTWPIYKQRRIERHLEEGCRMLRALVLKPLEEPWFSVQPEEMRSVTLH